MQPIKRSTTFAIDGYEVSATFADSKNTAALSQVKQILLSSFANNPSNPHPGDILAIPTETRDNNSDDSHRVP
ncbi:hypothetical protein [Oscillibacter sp.]|uniref:hypothetical protein n=1 Tax=Oscillibacter sp. TaxID=1945593 RepID=UPI00289F9107|nr:hypothetical protein [Oscillibacter sp.]